MRYLLFCALCILFISCKKKPDPVVNNTAPQLKIKIENVVNGQALVLNSVYYTNAHGDSFKVSNYLYYISNVKLITDKGTEYTESESYHLINQAFDTSKEFVLHNLPEANYTKITFLIGVDSIRNVSGAQTGALDPMNQMFWDWNQGYVMARLEGFSPQASIYPNNLGFHIADFKGISNTLHWVTLALPQAAKVAANKMPVVNIRSDVAEWFKTPNTIDFSQLSTITSIGNSAARMADNYADMFSVTAVSQ